MVEFDKLIKSNNLQDKVKAVSIIHDSLTYEVDKDPELIKWVNDNLIEIMCRPFVLNQLVQLKAELDIGYNMKDMQTLHNNASIEDIKKLI